MSYWLVHCLYYYLLFYVDSFTSSFLDYINVGSLLLSCYTKVAKYTTSINIYWIGCTAA